MVIVSFYMFEGIPSVLPVMEASDAKDNFICLLVSAIMTLFILDVVFAEISYYTYAET